MYDVFPTRSYKVSLKKLKHSGKFNEAALDKVIDTLASGKKLEPKHKDHQLRGEMREYRECHIKDDLLLIYQIRESHLILMLADIGTHSYLGL